MELAAKRRPYGNQHAVFVNNVQSMEAPEHVIAPFVGLDRVDRLDRCWAHTLYLFGCVGPIFHGVISNREGDVGTVSRAASPDKNKLVGQMVQRAPEVLKHIARDRSYTGGGPLALGPRDGEVLPSSGRAGRGCRTGWKKERP